MGMIAIIISPKMWHIHVRDNMIDIELSIVIISSAGKERPESPGTAKVETGRMRRRNQAYRIKATFLSIK